MPKSRIFRIQLKVVVSSNVDFIMGMGNSNESVGNKKLPKQLFSPSARFLSKIVRSRMDAFKKAFTFTHNRPGLFFARFYGVTPSHLTPLHCVFFSKPLSFLPKASCFSPISMTFFQIILFLLSFSKICLRNLILAL